VIILTCPPWPAQQTVYVRVEQRPSINWPDDWKPHDQPEQDHPSHEDPSPVYSGVLASTINTNVSGHLTVNDFGASGNLYTTVATTWLPVGSPLAMSTRDLDDGERFQTPWAHATTIAPATKKHLANPSTQKLLEARPGRRGRP